MSETPVSKHAIQLAGPADSAAMIANDDRAFVVDPIRDAAFPENRKHLTPADELLTWRISRHQKRIETKNVFFYKVAHPDNPERVIGHAGWFGPDFFSMKSFTQLSAKEKEKETAENSEPEPGAGKSDLPSCIDMDAYKQVMEAADKSRTEIWGDDTTYWYLGSLAVDPDFQRKGVASALMHWGTDQADKANLPIFLESTAIGSKFYTTFGFELVKTTILFDGKAELRHYIRRPKV